MPIIAIALVLYFANDISNLNERIGTSFPNQPSWVFQIEGGDEATLLSLSQQYPNLLKVADKNTGETELVDVREGHVGEYQVVTPFVVSLINLGFTPDPQNPPMNTANYQEGQVLTWKLTKSV